MKKHTKKRKLFRDEHGRFTTKKKFIHEKQQKQITKRIEKIREPVRYKVIQKGPVLIEKLGYFITVTALVPAEWSTSSTPVFEADKADEQFHMVIWRTIVRQSLKETFDYYHQLLANQSLYSQINEIPYIILSSELMMLHEDHSSYSIKVWEGTRVPRWLERTALKLHRQEKPGQRFVQSRSRKRKKTSRSMTSKQRRT